ncbi:MAG TPA: FIVAR domain-containing protein, partial [Candidatus Mediterraneibacter faecigallinarum]|nr:FIVAR domain-containing protein [Candidatus Mediterraneibacter faecigallinarum]
MSVKAADEERVNIAFDDPRVTYSEGHWNNYEDRQMYSNTVGSAVTVKFNGTGIAVIGGIAKNGPIAEVNIDDGAVVEDVDFFSASGTGSAGTVYEKRGLEDGEHTMVLTFTDRYNPAYGGGFAAMQIAIFGFEELHYSNIERTVTVNGGTADKEAYLAGDTVTIIADEPAADERFVKWESEDVNLADAYAASTTFVMPDKDVTVSAVFEEKRTEPATFYVDSENGDDSADGMTPETAWKTLTKVNETQLIGGDRILLKAGSVFEDQALSIKSGGTAENPIIIDMYDGDVVGAEAGERPHIKGNGKNSFEYQGNQISYGLHIKNASHVQVNNVEISNQGDTRKLSVGLCVEAAGCGVMQGVHINNVYIHDVNGTYEEKTLPNGGLYYVVSDHSNNTRFDDIQVVNNIVKRVSRTGISVGMTSSTDLWDGHGGIIPQEVLDAYGHTNVLIRNNYVEEAGGDAIVPMFSIKPVIEYNISNGASQNTKHTSMYNAGIWPWRCEDAVFQYNECYGTILNGDGQAYDCDWSRGTIYQYNYSHDNEGGFILICQSEVLDSIVRYNISQNDQRCLFLTSNTHNADVYNNTFYIGEGLDTEVVEDVGGVATLKNNIFYNLGTSTTTTWGRNFSYENNLYYGYDSTPEDSRKIIADPMFADPGTGGTGVLGDSAIDTLGGYRLQEDSPAIDAGLEIENNGGRDYFGTPLADGKTDIGAAEYAEPVSTAVLEYAIELARTADTEGVVPAVAEKFNECLTNAEDLLARVQVGDASVTQDMVDESWGELMRIMQMLSFKQGDKTDLCKVIEAADTIDLDKYLEVGKDEFKEALEEAKAAAADENAMQDEVDQAWGRLLTAMGNLRLIPDKDLLEDLINQAQAIDTAEYTEESVAALNSALAKAIEVYNDDQADEAQVKEAETALKASMDQLVKNESGSAGEGNTGDAGTGSDTGNADTGNGASGSTDD